MSDFVTRTLSRNLAIDILSQSLGFPWLLPFRRNIPLMDSNGFMLASDLFSKTPSPPFTRSLRDGYAVRSDDLVGASEASPVFLDICGEVPMGYLPQFSVSKNSAAIVHTGGSIPPGADSVIMLEKVSESGSMIEVKSTLQSGDNIIVEGEEFRKGHPIARKGDIIDFRNIGSLASCGFSHLDLIEPKTAIISTGDEVVPFCTETLTAGKIRDCNSAVIYSNLARIGIRSNYLGITGDDPEALEKTFNYALDSHDVVILSGGSSVSVRDHSVSLLKTLTDPAEMDIPVRGLNISPGKPTLAAGDAKRKKLAVCLPGHPHSCSVVVATFLVPLLRAMCSGRPDNLFRVVFIPAASDIIGRSGVEEFIPCRISEGGSVTPLWGKSGYVLALGSSDGLLRLPEEAETIRKGNDVEVWLW
jgi:molybdopterin molybdotransferase